MRETNDRTRSEIAGRFGLTLLSRSLALATGILTALVRCGGTLNPPAQRGGARIARGLNHDC
jgi:hypothetical protein